jgi:hypothetical protein
VPNDPCNIKIIDDAAEQFEAAGVRPMCILENHQQWILARQPALANMKTKWERKKS